MESELEEQATDKLCTNCKRFIKSTTFDLHEAHCRRHFVLCEKCGEPVPTKGTQEHFQEYHAPMSCDLCGHKVPKDQLEDHKESTCPEALLECKYCELNIRRVLYQDHVEQCGSRTDFCQLCNQRVMLKDMDEHQQMKCGHLKAEEPLDPYTLQQLQQEDDLFQPYGYEVTPPDDNVDVDPNWLENVADVCGDEGLDQLLSHHLLIENMRHVTRRDGHMTRRDGHVTRIEGIEGQQYSSQETDDEDYALRLQTEYDLEGSVAIATGNEAPPTKDVPRDLEYSDRELAKQIYDREKFHHERFERDEALAKNLQQQERQYQPTADETTPTNDVHGDRALARDQELLKQQTTEKDAELAKLLNQEEEQHRLKATNIVGGGGDITNGVGDDTLASQLQLEGKGNFPEYNMTDYLVRFEDEEPRPKTPPIIVEDEGKIPCQYCNELFPFETIMDHQQRCLGNYRTATPHHVCGHTHHVCGHTHSQHSPGSDRQLSDDLVEKIALDDSGANSTQDGDKVHCQHCGTEVLQASIAPHEALCEQNPEIYLKNAYCSVGMQGMGQHRPGEQSHGAGVQDMGQHRPGEHSHGAGMQGMGQHRPGEQSHGAGMQDMGQHEPVGSIKHCLDVSEQALGPCEVCGQLFSIKSLVKHEAKCRLTFKSADSRSRGAKRGQPKLAIKFPKQAQLSDHLPADGVQPSGHLPADRVQSSRHHLAHTESQLTRRSLHDLSTHITPSHDQERHTRPGISLSSTHTKETKEREASPNYNSSSRTAY